MNAPALRFALCALLVALVHDAPVAADDPAPADGGRSFAESLVEEINRGREALGLAPVTVDPALAAVAQRRADSMVDDHWFGFVSPAGEDVEGALEAAGYPFRLVTEKLVHSPLSASELGADWRRKPDGNRRSLFHAEVTRVGIGVRDDDASRLIDVVLAEIAGDATFATAGEPFDVERERAALVELLAEHRREGRRSRLRLDRPLAEAAQQHAEALLVAFARGQGSESIQPFGERLAEIERSYGRSGAGSASGGNKIWQRETSTQSRGTVYGQGSLSVSYATDARSAEQALSALLGAAEGPDLLDPGLRRLGVGVARGETGDRVRTAWVVAAARR